MSLSLSSRARLNLPVSGAEISAWSTSAQVLLTIGGSNQLAIVSLADPSKPALVSTTALAGPANSVAVNSAGLVAVAVEGQGSARYTGGQVQLFRLQGQGAAATLVSAGSLAVGAVPDSLSFSPDGSRIVVAIEGEPDELYNVDPEGGVAVITVNAAAPASSTVQTVDFRSLNGRAVELEALGIRVSGKAGNTVAQNLEPEYVAISADGKKALVTFQENNAVGVINLEGNAPTLESLRTLGVLDYGRGTPSLKAYDLSVPSPGTTSAGAAVIGGGLSGLWATGTDSQGRLTFLAVADRGPNGESTKVDGKDVRPFLLPDYQARLYQLALNERTGKAEVTGTILLKNTDGTPITGRPNGSNDETPVDASGKTLAFDRFGADLESISVDKDGNLWMADEYRPAIYKFNPTGTLLARYVPQGAGSAAGLSAGALGSETLPSNYATRQLNRGFEGMAYDAGTNRLFAFVQSPLDDKASSTDGRVSSLIRILEIDAATGTPVGEYLYPMAGKATVGTADSALYLRGVDKIGDVAFDPARGTLLVMERDSAVGPTSIKQVYEVSLKGATNVLGNSLAREEELSPDALAGQGITLARKVLLTNLSSLGYTPNDKPEGLARLADGRWAVINDNDFGIAPITGSDFDKLPASEQARYRLAADINGSRSYVYANGSDAKVQLGIVNFTPVGIDPTDRDYLIDLKTGQNLFGMRLADGIASFEAVGANGQRQSFSIVANEGDSRIRPDGDYTAPGGTVTKDASVYSDETRTGISGKSPENRLKTINTQTTAFSRPFAFGSRSVTILDGAGQVIWDSGDLLDRIAMAAGSYLDDRSDDKSIEPENVTVGQIGERLYAFVGLERSNGMVSFDITNPYAPTVDRYLPNGTGIVSPEGLLFIPAASSPNGQPLLISSNEVSKDLEVLSLAEGFDSRGLSGRARRKVVNDTPEKVFTLQILHASDLEGDADAIGKAPNFAAIVDKLEDQYANTIRLSAGDNIIPSPFSNAAADSSIRAALDAYYEAKLGGKKLDIREGFARYDVAVMDAIGLDASAVGNHEFDAGTSALREVIGADIRGTAADPSTTRWLGVQFPYLSANLNFSGDSNLGSLYTDEIINNAYFRSNPYSDFNLARQAPKLAPATVIERNGELIGVIGATTQVVQTISSTGGVTVADGSQRRDDMAALAAYLQPLIDRLGAQGVNKIVLTSHLQQFNLELELAPLLSGVDVIIAGGSDTIVAGNDDVLRAGDSAKGPYPVIVNGKDGKPTVIVSTDGQYNYVGQLVLNFDANGVLLSDLISSANNGPIATTEANVARLWGSPTAAFAKGTKGEQVKTLVDAVSGLVSAKSADIKGYTNVFLEGRRTQVRTEETNFGNLAADAQLWAARKVDPTVVVAIKNGGGLRSEIGEVSGIGNNLSYTPPSGGAISQLDIENALRFNNRISLVTVSASLLREVIEHAVAASARGATPGQFAQVSGLRYEFDHDTDQNSAEAGLQRLRSLQVVDSAGKVIDTIVANGALQGDGNRTLRITTLNFLADGGDNYPWVQKDASGNVLKDAAGNVLGRWTNRVDAYVGATGAVVGVAPGTTPPTGTSAYGEQQAFGDYLKSEYGTPAKAYRFAETAAGADQRIINLDIARLPVSSTALMAATPATIGLAGPDAWSVEQPFLGLESWA